jgi:hypothetical protein
VGRLSLHLSRNLAACHQKSKHEWLQPKPRPCAKQST